MISIQSQLRGFVVCAGLLLAVSAGAQNQGQGQGQTQGQSQGQGQGQGTCQGGGSGGGKGRQGPPPEAIDACAQKSAGATCSFSGREGETVQGTCYTPSSDRPLACKPANAPSGQ